MFAMSALKFSGKKLSLSEFLLIGPGKNFATSLVALASKSNKFSFGTPSVEEFKLIKFIPIGLSNSLLYSFLNIIVFFYYSSIFSRF